MKTDVAIVLGTRPEIIRLAPLIKELRKQDSLVMKLIHTGQHYSPDMSKIFFDELGLDYPDHTLSLHSTEPVKQISEIIDGVSSLFNEINPRLVCVWGDTNSSLGTGLAVNKMHIKLMHIEAGCRSGDLNMSEEYNRIILDHISDVLIPLSTHDKKNLIKERVRGKIHHTGDPLYDIFLEKVRTLKRKGLINKYKGQKYIGLFTLHRAENVDSKDTLTNILSGINKSLRSNKNCALIFPMHPRTKKMIEKYNLSHLIDRSFVHIVDPLGYDEMVELLMDADFAITDSGGFQKEAFFAKKPCITLRKSTEWVDTVRLKVNTLIDPKTFTTLPNIEKYIKSGFLAFKKIAEKPYGNGYSTKKLVDIIKKYGVVQ